MAVDVSEELVQEMSDLRAIHVANFGEEQLHPTDLLKTFRRLNYRLCSQTAVSCASTTSSSAEDPFRPTYKLQ